ncbi:MAG: hypothetical protein RhofKO_09230 [Rhodothermales bacterium]
MCPGGDQLSVWKSKTKGQEQLVAHLTLKGRDSFLGKKRGIFAKIRGPKEITKLRKR